jgi:hypothetical protein
LLNINRIASISVAGVVIAAACGAVAAASGAASGTAGETIKLVERAGAVKFIDLPPRARHQFDFSPGDLAIITRRIDNPSSGARVGSLELACMTVTSSKQQCTGTIELQSGTLAVSGLSQPSPTTVIAVVGGTGIYTGARGSGLARDRAGASDVADLTIQLSP